MIASDTIDLPPPPGMVIPRLHALLEDGNTSGNQRLTLITAPPGYGKTTLVMQWAARMAASSCLVLLITASEFPKTKRHQVTAFGIRSDAERILAAGVQAVDEGASTETIAQHRRALTTELSRLAVPCTLIVDGFDSFSAHRRARFVVRLVLEEESPPNLHVIATERQITHHPLGEAASRGKLRHIGIHDLTWTREEVARVLESQAVAVDDAATLDEIMTNTGGWPVGVAVMGTVSGKHDDPGVWAPFDDYVASNLVDVLDEATRALLLAVADFPWLNDDLWSVISVRLNGAVASLARVRSIVPMPRAVLERPGVQTYAIPIVLQESLRRLAGVQEAESPTARQLRHDSIEATASWLLAHDLANDVIDLAGATGEWLTILPSFTLQCRELAIRDDHRTLLPLLSALPFDVLISQDDLAYWFAMGLFWSNRSAEGERLGRRLIMRWAAKTDPLRSGQRHLLEALVALVQRNWEVSLAQTTYALEVLPTDAYLDIMHTAAMADILLWYLGRPDEALARFELARITREHLPHDQLSWSTYILPNHADRLAQVGNLQASYDMFRHLIDSYSSVYPEVTSAMTMRIALIELERGHIDAARTQMDTLRAIGSLHYWTLESHIACARILHATAQDDEAFALLYAAIRTATGEHNEIDLHRIQTTLAQIWLDRGEVDLLASWSASAPLPDDVWPRTFAYTEPGAVMAQLAMARGRPADALRLLDQLIGRNERSGQIALLVRLYSLKGLGHAQLGDVVACHRAIQRAIQLGKPGGFQRSYLLGNLDLRTLLATPQRTLDLAFTAFRPATVGGVVTLSEREREVLRLVAQGLTNAEIADTMFLSPLTIKNHLARIYQRLAVRNRSEAVLAARGQGLI